MRRLRIRIAGWLFVFALRMLGDCDLRRVVLWALDEHFKRRELAKEGA